MSGANRPEGGTSSLVLVCAGVFGLFTAVSMIGPILVDLARDLHVPLGRAGLSDLVPRQRGALFGLFGLTNQGGVVLGSALGGLVIDLAGYTGLGVVVVCQAGVAAVAAFRVAQSEPFAVRTAAEPEP